MNKKGVSAIVATLIIILLVIVSAGIVWVAIRNIISEGAEGIELGSFFLDLQIQKVNVERDQIKVTVKRGGGDGETEISVIAFIISDGENSQTIKKETTLKELETQKFTISSSEFADIAFVKEISIAPGITSESGKEKFGREVDTISDKDSKELTLENQWWTKNPEEIKILIIEKQGETGWKNKINDLGYNIEIKDSISSKEELENYLSTLGENERPNIIACIRTAWACEKRDLLNSLYDSGYYIFTEGNDNTELIHPISNVEPTTSPAGEIVPTINECAEPLTYGWTETPNSGGDSRRGILSIHSKACSIAKDNTLSYIEAIYLEESGKGRWYHHQPSGIAEEELINNFLKYLSR